MKRFFINMKVSEIITNYRFKIKQKGRGKRLCEQDISGRINKKATDARGEHRKEY
ncbi:hypothetical protein CLOM621_06613 [Clostridium sp. M62/1]|nr:hypothetical protein CLOM621_06613 [Clostridium sp. M62/1]